MEVFMLGMPYALAPSPSLEASRQSSKETSQGISGACDDMMRSAKVWSTSLASCSSCLDLTEVFFVEQMLNIGQVGMLEDTQM